MLFAIGAASSAIDLLKLLTSSKASPTAGPDFKPATATSSEAAATVSGATSPQTGNVSAQTMSALLDAQSQVTATPSTTTAKSQSKALRDLFNLIDGNGDGGITKSEFENALGAGGANVANADRVFDRLDRDGGGSVSLDELASALKGGKARHNHAGKPGEGDQVNALLKALDDTDAAASAAASVSAARKASLSYSSIDTAMQRQAQAIGTIQAPATSFSA